MKNEHIQKNPHQLVKNQHIFPKRSIERFCNSSAFVDLYMLKYRKKREAEPRDKFFCVKRKWDERAERGYSKDIEDNFQVVVDRVLQGDSSISDLTNEVLTRFYCLWNIRYHWSKFQVKDESLGVVPEFPLTVGDQDRLEKAHITYLTNKGTIPGRVLCGLRMQMNLDAAVEAMVGVEWGILFALEGEFLVPDNFSEAKIIPVTSNICFAAGYKSQTVERLSVGHINSLALASAEKYVFAKDLAKCPLLSSSSYSSNV